MAIAELSKAIHIRLVHMVYSVYGHNFGMVFQHTQFWSGFEPCCLHFFVNLLSHSSFFKFPDKMLERHI